MLGTRTLVKISSTVCHWMGCPEVEVDIHLELLKSTKESSSIAVGGVVYLK